MSMNIFIFAEREITFKKKNGEIGTGSQIVNFDALQTPTDVTKKIIASKDPVLAYIDWVLSECSEDQRCDRFAEDDIFQERDPIGVDIWNPGKEHVGNFLQWVNVAEEDGYTIKFEMV